MYTHTHTHTHTLRLLVLPLEYDSDPIENILSGPGRPLASYSHI